MTEEVAHRSVSQFGTYNKCGEAYYLEKVAKAPSLPAGWFIQGTAFHKAAEDWEASGRTLADADVLASYEGEWHSEFLKYSEVEPNIDLWLTGGRVKPQVDLERRYERGRQQVADYLTYARASEYVPVQIGVGEYAIEYPFVLDLDGIPVRGYIDQILEHIPTGRLLVRDLKTGTSLPTTSLQLAVYDLAIESDWGIRPGWGDYYMAKNNAPTAPHDLSHYSRELVTSWFKTMDAGVRAGVFIPNPGDACRTCGVSKFCSATGTDTTLSLHTKDRENV